MKHLALFILFLFWNCFLQAQSGVLGPDPCPPKHSDSRKPIPYASLREADVTWSKRVWRTIDLREKVNHPLYFPTQPDQQCRKSLFDVIKGALWTGELTAYANPVFDDEFKTPMTKADLEMLFTSIDTTYIDDINTGERVSAVIKNEVGSQDIKQYWIKEDWFFDKQRSVLDVRIIGICPLKEKRNEVGEVLGYMPLFWIYFPEARPVFAKAEVFNRDNDAERRTLDDVFWKRQFGSYIRKESNVYDRTISDYKVGLDALLEAEKIKEDIFILEHDLWHF